MVIEISAGEQGLGRRFAEDAAEELPLDETVVGGGGQQDGGGTMVDPPQEVIGGGVELEAPLREVEAGSNPTEAGASMTLLPGPIGSGWASCLTGGRTGSWPLAMSEERKINPTAKVALRSIMPSFALPLSNPLRHLAQLVSTASVDYSFTLVLSAFPRNSTQIFLASCQVGRNLSESGNSGKGGEVH